MYSTHAYMHFLPFGSHKCPLLSPVINVTLPDEKQNYVHRIGRVGRAERLAIIKFMIMHYYIIT